MEHSDLHPYCALHRYPRAASAWSSIFTLRETASTWWLEGESPHTSSLGPIMLIMLLCQFRSIIQMQGMLWGHKVRLRVNSNLAESSAHSQFVATQVNLCWGSSAPQTRKSPCSNSSLAPLWKKIIWWEGLLCGQQRKQCLWFDSHSHFIVPGISSNYSSY